MKASSVYSQVPVPAPRAKAFYDRRCGATLFFILVMMAVVAAVASTVFLVTKTDLNITENYKHELEALAQAEAGVHYIVTQVSHDLKRGAITLKDAYVPVHYTAPEGFNFGIGFDPRTIKTSETVLKKEGGPNRGDQGY